jgi:hypothetical protein
MKTLNQLIIDNEEAAKALLMQQGHPAYVANFALGVIWERVNRVRDDDRPVAMRKAVKQIQKSRRDMDAKNIRFLRTNFLPSQF